jgi:hypothetical protein
MDDANAPTAQDPANTHDETSDVQGQIAAQSRISDQLPELVSPRLARELVNHYPVEVKQNADRLASLACEIIQRERRFAQSQRAARLREREGLLATVRQLETALAEASREKARADATPATLGQRFGKLLDRANAFRRQRAAQISSLFSQRLGRVAEFLATVRRREEASS